MTRAKMNSPQKKGSNGVGLNVFIILREKPLEKRRIREYFFSKQSQNEESNPEQTLSGGVSSSSPPPSLFFIFLLSFSDLFFFSKSTKGPKLTDIFYVG